MYQIRGYDKMFDEFYVKPEVYSDYDEAFARCRMNESVIKVSAA